MHGGRDPALESLFDLPGLGDATHSGSEEAEVELEGDDEELDWDNVDVTDLAETVTGLLRGSDPELAQRFMSATRSLGRDLIEGGAATVSTVCRATNLLAVINVESGRLRLVERHGGRRGDWGRSRRETDESKTLEVPSFFRRSGDDGPFARDGRDPFAAAATAGWGAGAGAGAGAGPAAGSGQRATGRPAAEFDVGAQAAKRLTPEVRFAKLASSQFGAAAADSMVVSSVGEAHSIWRVAVPTGLLKAGCVAVVPCVHAKQGGGGWNKTEWNVAPRTSPLSRAGGVGVCLALVLTDNVVFFPFLQVCGWFRRAVDGPGRGERIGGPDTLPRCVVGHAQSFVWCGCVRH